MDDLLKSPRQLILERVDEYTLYCYYLDMEVPLRRPINSSIRDENDIDHCPSLCIFPSQKGKNYDEFDFTWKDMATGKCGNIFFLLKRLFKLRSIEEVYAMINQDFDLDLHLPTIVKPKIELYKPPEIETNIKFRVKSIPFTTKGKAFWDTFEVTNNLLTEYFTTQISFLWRFEGDDAQYCPDPTFAYRIGNHYQTYSPFEKKGSKFRNDYPADYFFGYLQLPESGDRLIIDKSAKDVIFCRVLGEWAVCGKSETTLIPHHKMMELKDRFKRVVLMLDNDQAGHAQTEKYLHLYPWLEPKFLTDAKDKTDLAKLKGVSETRAIIQNLLL